MSQECFGARRLLVAGVLLELGFSRYFFMMYDFLSAVMVYSIGTSDIGLLTQDRLLHVGVHHTGYEHLSRISIRSYPESTANGVRWYILPS